MGKIKYVEQIEFITGDQPRVHFAIAEAIEGAGGHLIKTQIVERLDPVKCPGCKGEFFPETGQQRYHNKQCNNRHRQKRFREKEKGPEGP